jgi:glutathione synthase/RimK-type ligase-like ATP-grasp enzyme
MKIAIHHTPGSFSDKWIEYCQTNRLDYKLVNCFDGSIIEQVKDCQYLLWNWGMSFVDSQFAKSIITAIEQTGIQVFPNIATCWHYDDKVAQMYLLQSIGAPLIKSYVFYDKREALDWVNSTDYPKVFKLRKGAGSNNVQLVRSKSEAVRLVYIAFGKGFNPVRSYFRDLTTKVRNMKETHSFKTKLRRAGKSIMRVLINKHLAYPEKGYIYFQNFIPDNDHDTRVTVIGNRVFGLTRPVRPNDFRASGSGHHLIDYSPEVIDLNCIKIAHQVADRIGSQCLAFDFVLDKERNPLIVEISYTFPPHGGVYLCPGYWDRDLNWHEGHFWPEDAIIADLLAMGRTYEQ